MSRGKCPTIIGLKLDRESIATIKDLKEKTKLFNFVGIGISFSMVVNMFSSRSVPTVAFNISTNDWELFAESMAAVSTINRGVIERDARFQMIRLSGDAKQRAFWEGIKNGCTY